MRTVLTGLSDKLVGFVVPSVTAHAQTQGCQELRSYCNGACPFWWWRRAHVWDCNGIQHTDYECCGCGC